MNMETGINVERQEIKFVVDQFKASLLKSELSKLLKVDENNNNDGYLVTSLYFDTPLNDDFYNKVDSLNEKRKIRIRIYNRDLSTIKFEVKSKRGKYQKKTSHIISKDLCHEIISGHYSNTMLLDDYNSPFSIIKQKVYRPKVIVEYNRYALIYPDFNVRITFDSNIKSSYDVDLLRLNFAHHTVENQNVILEVKFDGILPNSISNILSRHSLNHTSFSKYSNARECINF